MKIKKLNYLLRRLRQWYKTAADKYAKPAPPINELATTSLTSFRPVVLPTSRSVLTRPPLLSSPHLPLCLSMTGIILQKGGGNSNF